jgi:hypothetical protein
LPELLTLWALSRRLRVLSLSRLWLWGLLALWVGFDISLIVSRQLYLVLPIAYGLSQAAFLFDRRKAGGPVINPEE